MRYLARKYGYAGGQSELEQAITDQYADVVTDLVNELVKAHFESDPTRKADLQTKLQTEVMPRYLTIFEKRLAENNGFLSGDRLSYADVRLISLSKPH